jgi:hypothetical protein
VFLKMKQKTLRNNLKKLVHRQKSSKQIWGL